MPSPLHRQLLSALAFVAVGLVLNAAVATVYRTFVESRTLAAKHERLFERYDGEIRVLAIGASHSVGGFDTRLTDDAYTYAFAGETYPTIFGRLRYVLNKHPEVEHVIAPLGPYYFEAREHAHPTVWIGTGEVVRYAQQGGEWWAYLKDQLRRNYFPYAGKHQRSWDWLNGAEDKVNRREPIQGFQPSFRRRSIDYLEESAEEVVATHYTGATDPIQAYFLDRIAELCAERGIRLTLVEWPATPQYFRLAEEHVDPAVQEAALASVRERIPADFIDLSTLFFGREEEVFGNADHINAVGAFEATQVILSRLGLPIRSDVEAPLDPPAHMLTEEFTTAEGS